MAKGLNTKKLVVVDLECTCWGEEPPDGHKMEIIEIGICTYDRKTGDICDKESFYVKPQSQISEYCTTLTGITPELIKKEGRPLNEVINSIQKRYPLKGCAWASWGDFDRIHFIKECTQKNIPYPFRDTHLNVKLLYALFKGKDKGISVGEAIVDSGMEFEGRPHCGSDDAFNIARILKSLLDSNKE
jgi:inhibitor of KinA sporulation pathway (predicted exonuclease)